ncbi:helix-turn-helix transcriptional regulator [Nesterenkonia sp. MY13]|uniref:Helix-turn-helix transcriptional regulator n=1 Tax=Nesterenkonia sedimenti TaxID=1463632 RepID=A0A7X8TIE2_9MICC|nr:helix-turn-helix transcriptional regulator [Nesterenkonia sedimenti]NLS09169.1 helix-turn-helix transcriptional regulator [Nesterenkonia sedimenti]
MQAESETRRLLRARDAMDRRFAEPLNVPAVAQVAWMSPAHFTRRFRAVFGQTPHQYLYRRRIERAQWLLRTTPIPVTEIARAVGYESLGTFTRTFRRLVGTTPTQFRDEAPAPGVPSCFARAWRESSSFGEAEPAEASIG